MLTYEGRITRFDIASAIDMVINNKDHPNLALPYSSHKQVTASMRCSKEGNSYNNVYFTVFDPGNTSNQGNNITVFDGFVNGTTTFSSFPARPTTT